MSSIGVVIPSRNFSHFIAQALQSLALQETTLRVVIVNDGGSDGHILDSVAQSFTSPELSVDVIHMPYTRGIGIARNSGAAYLHTDSFLFLDADDTLRFGAVDALASALQGRKGVDFSYGNYTENGVVIETPRWNSKLLKTQNVASYCNLWRADSFWRIGGYSDIAVAEDWEFQVRAMGHGMFGEHVDALIFDHRLHDKNKWTRDAVAHGGMAGVAQLVANYQGN